MKASKRNRLIQAGWEVGSAASLLGLDEAAISPADDNAKSITRPRPLIDRGSLERIAQYMRSILLPFEQQGTSSMAYGSRDREVDRQVSDLSALYTWVPVAIEDIGKRTQIRFARERDEQVESPEVTVSIRGRKVEIESEEQGEFLLVTIPEAVPSALSISYPEAVSNGILALDFVD